MSGANIEHILDLLAAGSPATTKRMFGCIALMRNGRMFAMLDGNGTLYVKADDRSPGESTEHGGEPFTYLVKNKDCSTKAVTMSYHTLPDEAFDSDEELTRWLLRGMAATEDARRAKTQRSALTADLHKLGLL